MCYRQKEGIEEKAEKMPGLGTDQGTTGHPGNKAGGTW